MSYFTEEFISFFEELNENNNREWFHSNKKQYEEFVKEPFKQFIEELIYRIQEKEPDLAITAKDAIFRIYRDIRFSKDKTPYKVQVSASIKNGGRTGPNHPGYYIQMSHKNIMLGGGCYHLDKEGLYKIRTNIAESLDDFSEVINDKKFVNKFGEVIGDKNKRLPKEFKEIQEKQPLIANKYFFFRADIDPKILLETDFMDQVMEFYETGRPFNQYLKQALEK
ncbi:MAG: DUF2461 domain-containing protein [Candidatus Kariarchaeaceae archaeon]